MGILKTGMQKHVYNRLYSMNSTADCIHVYFFFWTQPPLFVEMQPRVYDGETIFELAALAARCCGSYARSRRCRALCQLPLTISGNLPAEQDVMQTI